MFPKIPTCLRYELTSLRVEKVKLFLVIKALPTGLLKAVSFLKFGILQNFCQYSAQKYFLFACKQKK